MGPTILCAEVAMLWQNQTADHDIHNCARFGHTAKDFFIKKWRKKQEYLRPRTITEKR
jgi:hypothetical protein